MPSRSIVTEPNQHSITATCVFNAPRELVFRIMNDPEAIPEWWGPRVLTTTVDKMEPRSGGSWRYVLDNGQGNQWAFHGVYHSVDPSVRTVSTYEDEGLPGHVSLETTIFEDHEGGTKVTTISVFQTVEDRDAMLQGGMEEGGDESMNRLEELLARMHAAV